MDSKTLLLGTACLIALSTATSHGAALGDGSAPMWASDRLVQGSGEPLIEFLIGSGGTVSAETVDVGLNAAFKSVSAANMHDISPFFRNVIALGVTPDARDALESGLVHVVSTSALSDDNKSVLLRALADISGGAASFTLAQADNLARCIDDGLDNDEGCILPRIRIAYEA